MQVTVKATANTGLATDDVFYFGNAVGETGDNPANAYVNAFDTGAVRDHPQNFLNPAAVDNVYDLNKDGLVNAFDFGIARDNATGLLNALKLITAPAVSSLLVSQQNLTVDALELSAPLNTTDASTSQLNAAWMAWESQQNPVAGGFWSKDTANTKTTKSSLQQILNSTDTGLTQVV